MHALPLLLAAALTVDASAARPTPEQATGAVVIVLDAMEAPSSKDRVRLFRKVFKKHRTVVGARDLGTVFCFAFAETLDDDAVTALVTKAGMPVATVRRTANCDRPPGEAFQRRASIVERWNVTLADEMSDTDLKIMLLGVLQRGHSVADMLIPTGYTSSFCMSFEMPPDRAKWDDALDAAGLTVKKVDVVKECPKP